MTPGALIYRIIGVAMDVHRALGPHHQEIVYHRATLDGLAGNGLSVVDRPTLYVRYDDKVVAEYRPDCIVRQGDLTVIVDFKADGRISAADIRQVRGYLAAHTSPATGLLINFGNSRLDWKRVYLTGRSKLKSKSRSRQWTN